MATKMNTQRRVNRIPRGANVRKETPAKTTIFESLKEQFGTLPDLSSDLFYKVLWFAFLGVIYIFTQNQYDKLTYKVSRAKTEMNQKRAVYISKKADYMYASKHSEISRRLEARGLDKNLMPPIKIEVGD